MTDTGHFSERLFWISSFILRTSIFHEKNMVNHTKAYRRIIIPKNIAAPSVVRPFHQHTVLMIIMADMVTAPCSRVAVVIPNLSS